MAILILKEKTFQQHRAHFSFRGLDQDLSLLAVTGLVLGDLLLMLPNPEACAWGVIRGEVHPWELKHPLFLLLRFDLMVTLSNQILEERQRECSLIWNVQDNLTLTLPLFSSPQSQIFSWQSDYLHWVREAFLQDRFNQSPCFTKSYRKHSASKLSSDLSE